MNDIQIISMQVKFPLLDTIIIILILQVARIHILMVREDMLVVVTMVVLKIAIEMMVKTNKDEKGESTNTSLSSWQQRIQQQRLQQKEEVVVILTTTEVSKEAHKEDQEAVLGIPREDEEATSAPEAPQEN